MFCGWSVRRSLGQNDTQTQTHTHTLTHSLTHSLTHPQEEIRDTYGKHIEQIFDEPLDNTLTKMSVMYNGYCFHPDQDDLTYNPVSIIAAINSRSLGSHWAHTAPSSIIVDTIGLHGMEILRGVNITKDDLFAPVSVANYLQNWAQVAFQTGYASITDVKIRANNDADLVLRPPNEEVRLALMKGFADKLTKTMSNKRSLVAYAESLLQLDFAGVQTNLRNMFKSMRSSSLPETEEQLSGYVITALQHFAGFELVYVDVPQKLDSDPKAPGRSIESEPEPKILNNPYPNTRADAVGVDFAVTVDVLALVFTLNMPLILL